MSPPATRQSQKTSTYGHCMNSKFTTLNPKFLTMIQIITPRLDYRLSYIPY